MSTGTSKLQLIIDLANKMFNTKLKQTQDNFTKATNNLMGKAKKLKIENAKAFGAMTDQFPAISRGMDLLSNKYVLMAGAAAGIGILAAKSIKVGIEDEMQRTSFEVMLGGKEAAKNIVNEIATYAAKTPYDKLGLGKAAQTMLGFGIAQEKVMPNLKMLGDIAMGDAQKLESLSLAFAQISSAGKLNGQDLMQLINAGFNPLSEIAKKTGMSIGELKDQMSNGNISFEMVEAAFKSATAEGGQFHGMADKMSQTFGGKLSSMMDAFSETLIGVYNVLQPILIPAIDMLTSAIENIVPTFQWLSNLWSQGNPVLIGLAVAVGVVTSGIALYNIAVWAAALRTAWLAKQTKIQLFWDKLVKISTVAKTAAMFAFSAVGVVVTTMLSKQKMATIAQNSWNWIVAGSMKAWTAAQWLLNVALNANPIGLIVLAIAGLVAIVAVSIKKYESWCATLLMLMGPVGWLINGIMALKRNWQSVSDAFSKGGILAGLKRIGIVLLDTILYPVQQLLKLLAKIPGLSHLAGKGADKIADMRKKLNLIPDGTEKTPAEKTHKKQTDKAKAQQGKKEEVNDHVFDALKKEGVISGSEDDILEKIKSLKEQRGKAIVGSDQWKDLGKQIQKLEATLGKGGKGKGAGDQVSRVTGAGQEVKNITVNIDSFVKGGINTANTTLNKMDTRELESWFNEMLMRTIRNLELAQ